MAGRTILLLVVLAAGIGVDGTAAQTMTRRFADSAALSQQPPPPEVGVRLLGGGLGSAVGLGLGLATAAVLIDECTAEAWACPVTAAGLGGVLGSTVGSIAGIHLAAGVVDEEPNTAGTIVGAGLGILGGALVGFGVAAATDSDAGLLVGYTITQGAIAAMASLQD